MWNVYFMSRYYPLEGVRYKKVNAETKKQVRDNWYDIIGTDEYRIIKIEEVK